MKLNEPTNNKTDSPVILKQLALEIIGNISQDSIIVYTDGSRTETGKSGSGSLISVSNNQVMLSKRNPDHCSNVQAQLITIEEALKTLKT